MKKLIYLILISLLAVSCSKENEFPDYDYNAVYFPLQYPLRTLILGDDRADNSMDKELKFHIGACIGGLYENNNSWNIDFVVDPSLVDSLLNKHGDTLEVLPESFYSVSPADVITILPGSFTGLIEVQLTDAFLDDPKAVQGNYVLPLRITDSDADSILTGLPYSTNPNRNLASDWRPGAKPKDYTLFGIKFINPFHGAYFHRGIDITYNAGIPVDTVVYRQKYTEYDQIWKVNTTGRNSCETNGIGINVGANYSMKLTFNADGTIVVEGNPSSVLQPSGAGNYVENAESWGGLKHDAIYLNYQYAVGTFTHQVKDTLVFRNNGVVYEENVITVFKN